MSDKIVLGLHVVQYLFLRLEEIRVLIMSRYSRANNASVAVVLE
jgi:hypothetical protein